MAFKHLSLIISLALIVLLSILSVSESAHTHQHSPIAFLKHLRGCKKGDHVKGISKLKEYLHKYGYLDYKKSNSTTPENDDDFDGLLESAVKIYQTNFNIRPSGVMDRPTITQMAMPRCGNPDIINGTNFMKPKKSNSKSRHHLRTVAHYSFFSGNLRWRKTHLTYSFVPGTRPDAIEPVARAFQTWQQNTHFTFQRVEGRADLTIGFFRSAHGDVTPFEGPGGALAHAAPPEDGNLHYDADESWSAGPVAGYFDMETVGLHEIGHLLGLGHSNIFEAIMFPGVAAGSTKGLGQDDIMGIRALYQV